MKIRLAYGKNGIEIDVPDNLNIDIIEPRFKKGLSAPETAIRKALQSPIGAKPLKELAKPTDRIGIIFNDITRPTPNQLILPAILSELEYVPQKNIIFFNAVGTHRKNTRDELENMIGKDILGKFKIVQNDAFDKSTQAFLGKTKRGNEIWINKELLKCDFRILTGFIEPHFFAGFSGGGKAIMPGMAGVDTVLKNHSSGNISNLNSTWGITFGNPIFEEIQEIALRTGPQFLVNVTLNRRKEITNVFAGDLVQAHEKGCRIAKENAMAPASRPFDLVVTTNSGYPLDQNLYQSVKGMSAAAQIVRQGGAIIIASECRDGVPSHGLYAALLQSAQTPPELMEMLSKPDCQKQDQWQAQIQCQIQAKADVYVYSSYLTDEQIKKAMLKPCHDIPKLVRELANWNGSSARIAILPEGPQTIPYLK